MLALSVLVYTPSEDVQLNPKRLYMTSFKGSTIEQSVATCATSPCPRTWAISSRHMSAGGGDGVRHSAEVEWLAVVRAPSTVGVPSPMNVSNTSGSSESHALS